MSKQYIPWASAENAHISDIYSLEVTNKQLLSVSGGSAIKVHSITDTGFPLVQSIDDAHSAGCHHIVTDEAGSRAISAGFDGILKAWSCHDGHWVADEKVTADLKGASAWAIALSCDGQYLAGVTEDGRVKAWDLAANGEIIRDHVTKGSFGLAIDLSPDGRLIATGHQNGRVYVFSTETGRMPYSLPGLVDPIRAVAFSPGSKVIAAAGDSKVISLYDSSSGNRIAYLTGHTGWITSLAWSSTGEFLLSGSFDGKIKVWSMETKTCVATIPEIEKTVWSAKWLPKIGRAEGFVLGGANCSIDFYREPSA
ncbi:hypothetical protein N7535_002301 [Penicillium sp. DV-2018c]|nr:hypothetical protein N7461_004455 [Penicillium sp. DV-2018c]KAJ5583681.1 hypothetical protein N7535_002301 [Penicillium sp. DV-2018c]